MKIRYAIIMTVTGLIAGISLGTSIDYNTPQTYDQTPAKMVFADDTKLVYDINDWSQEYVVQLQKADGTVVKMTKLPGDQEFYAVTPTLSNLKWGLNQEGYAAATNDVGFLLTLKRAHLRVAKALYDQL